MLLGTFLRLRVRFNSEFGLDNEIPSLLRLRNVSEHADEYNLDLGRDRNVSRRQVQTWFLDTAEAGGPIWGWLGERLNVGLAEQAALALYRGFVADCKVLFDGASTAD